MNRRNFVRTLSLAAPFVRTLLASAAGLPRVYFLGMSALKMNADDVTAHLPAVGYHRAFIVASNKVLTDLGLTALSANTFNLDVAHIDLRQLGLNSAACLSNATLVISSSGKPTLSAKLESALPKVGEMYERLTTKAPERYEFPNNSPSVQLKSAGTLRLPFQPSRNVGTWGFQWRLEKETGTNVWDPIGDWHGLTDLVVFDSTSSPLTLTLGGKTASLKDDDRMWLVNFPVQQGVDRTNQIIEHAHEWFDIAYPPLNAAQKKIRFYTHARFERLPVKENYKFTHPCLQGAPEIPDTRRYIPPDSDPCFAVQL